MILHIVNKAFPSHDALSACLDIAHPEDQLILIEDGVYNALDAAFIQLQERWPELPHCHILLNDAQARGIDHRLNPQVDQVDYAGFVELAARTQSSISWF